MCTHTQEGGRIECKDSDLIDADSLKCDSARRRRHAVSPSVKQRWRVGRMRRQTDSDGLTHMFRDTTSLVSAHIYIDLVTWSINVCLCV